MLKSYFTMAIRGLIKNKVFSLINILGLSVGLTTFILIMLYVRFEFSYDDFHKNADNIYRVATKVTLQNEVINHESDTYDGIIKALRTDFPEVKAMTVISDFSSEATFIRYDDSGRNLKPIETFSGCYADAGFFEVFSFPLTKGNVNTVLDEPYSAVISESLATSYFMGDAVGKVLEFKNDDKPSKRLMITGVVKDVPENSHFKFDIVVNIPDEEVGFWQWGGHTYMLLSSDAIPKEVEYKLDLLAQASNGLKINKDDYGQVSTFKLQPLRDIHLFSQLDYEFEPGGQGTLVYSILSLAVIILIIAWVNYINLSTAISTQRLREIGIRKVVGASRFALMFQVLAESSLFNFLSLVIALALAWITMPLFASLLGGPVNFIPLMDSNTWIAIACFLILGTLFSGGYPAFVISSIYPVGVLKGKSGSQAPVFRKGLVIFQFTSAIVLMIISIVAYRQLSFMQSRELGINIDQVLVIKALNFDQETWSDEAGGYVVDSVYHERAALFKNELRKHSNIVNASAVAFVPGEVPVW